MSTIVTDHQSEITTEEKFSKLHTLIKDMDIPDYRKTNTNPDNLKWLGRNIQVRNSNHANFTESRKLIVSILRDHNLLSKRELKHLSTELGV